MLDSKGDIMPKYKLKSSRSMLKRFKFTSTGKLLRHRACRNHLLQKKTAQRKQKLRTVIAVLKVDLTKVKSKLL